MLHCECVGGGDNGGARYLLRGLHRSTQQQHCSAVLHCTVEYPTRTLLCSLHQRRTRKDGASYRPTISRILPKR